MKTVRKLLACLLVICMFTSVLLCSVSAAEIPTGPESTTPPDAADETNAGTRMVPPIQMVDAAGNRYGYTGWSSLTAAKNYYGHDFTYRSCDVYYCGGYFNYYYLFSEGTRMYFGVLRP